jgi:intracellular septation protein
MSARKLHPHLKLLLDFAPLGVFFLAYRLGDVMAATAALIAATAVSLLVIYAVERKIAAAPLVTGIIVAVFGGLTLLLNDEAFIKLKPTIINLLFAGTLLVGAYGLKRGFLKYLLDIAFQLTDEGWLKLSKRWGFFFLFLAGLNEVIWRSFPTDFWVNFKVFGMFTLTMAFAVSQFKLIERYKV